MGPQSDVSGPTAPGITLAEVKLQLGKVLGGHTDTCMFIMCVSHLGAAGAQSERGFTRGLRKAARSQSQLTDAGSRFPLAAVAAPWAWAEDVASSCLLSSFSPGRHPTIGR